MSFPKRTRPRLGPLTFVVLGWLVLGGHVLLAHDPGLSSLDVNVRRGTISVSLSIAASDVALIASSGDARPQLRELIRETLRISVDGETLRPMNEEVSIEDGAAYLHLSFAIDQFVRPQQMVIASGIQRRLSRGHRELMIVRLDDRVVIETLLDAGSAPVTIDLDGLSPSTGSTGLHFLAVGFSHILSGYDHLLFLAGLVLAARTVRDVVWALTSFTVAHSASLALVVIGGMNAPPSIVEPLIAASIVWVGLENLARGQSRSRWPIVFGFGLIHGFGFAGALLELRVVHSAVETAVGLFSFNVGVEAGQLAVAACLMPLVWLTRKRPVWYAGVLSASSMVMVIAGGYWLIDRLQW